MKLCLGTAQFGLDYGINNPRGKIPESEISEILNCACDNDIIILDTASAYGNSESVLGEAIVRSGKRFNLITKYPATTNIRPFQWIDISLECLRTQKVYGYLFHNYSIFLEHPDYIDDFIKIKQAGKSDKIGFSLYYPHEAEYILEKNIPCDIIQVPYNIFDQRFGYLFSDMKNRGIEIHVRSVFLQGLFFMAPGKLDKQFESIKDSLYKIKQTAQDKSISIAALCLGFVHAHQHIAYAVIGIDSVQNLKENISNYNLLSKLHFDTHNFDRFATHDENIILPFNWKNG